MIEAAQKAIEFCHGDTVTEDLPALLEALGAPGRSS